MAFRKIVFTLGFAACATVLAACASQPAPSAAAAPAPAPKSAPAAAAAQTEADTAEGLEKKFQEAARSYRKVEKNGETMYCKKEKPINSTIPRMQCITESQLRLEVEQMDEMRERMRNSSRCTRGPGCSAGG